MIKNINSRVAPAYVGGKDSVPARAVEPQAEAQKSQDTDTFVPEETTKQPQEAVSYKPNTALVEQLKQEQATLQARFITTVRDMLAKQGIAINEGEGIWKTIAGGNYTVDAETQAQAKAAIAEDGYWGSNQTSQRLVGFAKALVGGDPSRVEEMRTAFQKGYQQAADAWGGTLPPLAQETYDKTMELFDQWAQEGQKPEGE